MKRILLLALVVTSLSACYARAVVTAPPPPRAVVVTARPGFIWVDGRWGWSGSTWVWYDGYYERERPGYVWIQGSWGHRGGRYHYTRGYWRHSPRAVVVPSRRPAPAPARPNRVHDYR